MKKIKGFTLIELMVVVAVIVILMAVAVPSFSNLIANNRITSNTNSFMAAFAFARAEALGRGTPIFVSSTSDSVAWGSGLRIWQDANNDSKYSAGEELRIISSFGATTITGNQKTFTFSALGNVDKTDIFLICDSRTGEKGRSITLVGGGALKADTNICS